MHRFSKRLIVTVLTFVIGLTTAAAWVYYRESQRITVILPNAHWEPIFFKLINRTTELAQIGELRKTVVRKGDVEVRFWHGFGLGALEGVVIKRIDGRWSAIHIKADDCCQPESVQFKNLAAPRSGWEPFWRNITDKGLLTLPDPSEINYESGGIDGQGFVVEINRDHVYRTYNYWDGDKCPEAHLAKSIDIAIGMEFDSGREQCKTAEWFPCAKLRIGQD